MRRLLIVVLGMAMALAGQSPAKLTARAEFRCLWWSAEQQKKFNPNQPPPKTTEVLIDRWEYTDPVSAPHPDTITAHVFVRNDGGSASRPISVRAQIRWKTGLQSKPAAAQWEPRRIALASWKNAGIAPGEEATWTASIDIQTKMAALEKRDWWPHELELTVTGADLRTGRVVFQTVRPFRILPGD